MKPTPPAVPTPVRTRLTIGIDTEWPHMQMRYLAIPPLLVLAACARQPDNGSAPRPLTPAASAPAEGWKLEGRHDAFYSRFKGSQTVSGDAHITWEDSPLPPGQPGEYVLFHPDQQSRTRTPILEEWIDVPADPRTLAALGLPASAPTAATDCGYQVTATVVLGDYYKYDQPESDGFDASEILKVTTVSEPKVVKCNPYLEKLARTEKWIREGEKAG